jgi:hypothetical protein
MGDDETTVEMIILWSLMGLFALGLALLLYIAIRYVFSTRAGVTSSYLKGFYVLMGITFVL